MPSEIAPADYAKPVTRRSGMFRALSNRDYRLFWTGAFLSNVGTWMQAVAQGWLVLKLTDSPFWLGLDAFMATAPAFIFTLIGGVFADLIDRRRLLLFTQVIAGLAALGLAAVVATNIVNRWMVLGFSFVTGCCMALASPSYLAMTYDLVGREDLANAIAMNSTQFQLSRVVGPALAGVAFRVFGLAGCFFANGLSFIAVVAALWKVRPLHSYAPSHSMKDRRALWQDLVEGFRYVRNRPRVLSLLLLGSINSLFGAPYFTLVPIYARDIFHLGETGLALMMGTAGAGAFCSALLVAYLGDFRRKGWFVLGGAITFGLCIMGFALSSRLRLSLLFLFGLGFALVMALALTNTLLQKLVTDQMRGRVMSMFLLSFVGTMPIGNILAGTASNHFGPQRTLAVGGFIITLVATGVAIFNKRLRDLY
ncbi:MAG TPA: MFS transporter [Pyrinomonadaceae bacterium]|jgi:MFS family permease|nr:MFS transporter [Pyrinomonadaceae bacterium]